MNWVPTWEIVGLWVGYCATCFFLHYILPATTVQGEPLPPDFKKRLTYRLNGLRVVGVFLTTYALLYKAGCINPQFLIDNVGALFVVANIWAFSWILIHYLMGRNDPESEYNDNIVLDLWFGVQLNPRILHVDMKVFAYTPSMLAWLVFNLSSLMAHYERFHTVHTGMLLYQILTGIYVIDYFWFERAILSIYDVIEERFGFMLIWGDYVWISFLFPLAGYSYLVHNDAEWSTLGAVALFAFFIVGFELFRGSNLQKATIKANPHAKIWGKEAEFIDGKLLVSGYWGIGRKINYTGDLIIAYSFALTTGIPTWTGDWQSFLIRFLTTWAYPTYLTILLLQRQHRDDVRCRRKYGKTWEKYCERVPYRMIPGIF